MRIDAEPDRCGRWLLTGSQQFGLMRDVSESLAGRVSVLEKLTATPGAGHVEPLNRFVAVAGNEATGQGILVCRTERERALPNDHRAMPWKAFPDWLREQLVKAND